MATVTAPEIIRKSDLLIDPSDVLYEVIDGQAVEVNEMGAYGSIIASDLFLAMAPVVRQDKIGRLVSETLFRISSRRDRRPDLALVSYDRWGKNAPAPQTNAWDVVPDLLIEIISKTDESREVLEKVREYFDAGARAVWLVYPSLEVFHVFDSFTQIRVLTRADVLEGGALIPGFRLPLSDLFQEEAEAPDEESNPAN